MTNTFRSSEIDEVVDSTCHRRPERASGLGPARRRRYPQVRLQPRGRADQAGKGVFKMSATNTSTSRCFTALGLMLGAVACLFGTAVADVLYVVAMLQLVISMVIATRTRRIDHGILILAGLVGICYLFADLLSSDAPAYEEILPALFALMGTMCIVAGCRHRVAPTTEWHRRWRRRRRADRRSGLVDPELGGARSAGAGEQHDVDPCRGVVRLHTAGRVRAAVHDGNADLHPPGTASSAVAADGGAAVRCPRRSDLRVHQRRAHRSRR